MLFFSFIINIQQGSVASSHRLVLHVPAPEFDASGKEKKKKKNKIERRYANRNKTLALSWTLINSWRPTKGCVAVRLGTLAARGISTAPVEGEENAKR